MTRNSPRRKVPDEHWLGRLMNARDFHEAAQQAITLAEQGQNMNPAISNIVLAAIAYSDCLTAMRSGVINTQDHAAAPKLLRDVLRDSLPNRQEQNFRKIVDKKDESQYGAKTGSLAHANSLMSALDDFAEWTEGVVSSVRRNVG